MKVTFEKEINKKTFLIEAVVKDGRIFLLSNGVEATARAGHHPKHGWYYEVRYNKTFVKSFGVKGEHIAFAHPSAKEALEEAKRQQEAKKQEKTAKIEKRFAELPDETAVMLSWGTDFQTAFIPGDEVSEHPFFKEVVNMIQKAGWKAQDIELAIGRKASVDMGDYSITHRFELTLGEMKQLFDAAKKDAEKKEREKQMKVAKEQAVLNEKFDTAKKTGKKVEIRRWTAECCDPNEECNLDVITQYAMPDGTIKTERHHTW